MRRKRILGLVCLFALCMSGAMAFQGKGQPAVTEITLERTECRGTCPAYEVTLRPDGTITYVGKAHVARKETFTGHFSKKDFRRLTELVKTLHYEKLKDLYGSSEPIDITATVTSVDWGGKRKTVIETQDEQPTSLWTIEMVIDSITNQVDDWKMNP